MINKIPIVVIGAGPAGLSAGIEAAKRGVKVLILDENLKAGGQLFKQIHKFFGSKEHLAGTRGFQIGTKLLEEAEKLNIEVYLNSQVCAIDENKNIWALKNGESSININADKLILATGAMEKPISFPGWTLPGVMGAGAAQTMINIHRVLPGKKVLMIGSGNVGVIVSYQLLQAGGEVVGIIEAAPQLGAYGVHTAKVRRLGVPFYTSYTIFRALGNDFVEGAEIVKLNENFQRIKGTEKIIDVDTICIATGLTPINELAWMIGCKFHYIPKLGGHVPIHNRHMETTVKDVYVSGDLTGIEEASTAIEEGRLAGIHASESLGFCSDKECSEETNRIWTRLNELRDGPFGIGIKEGKTHILSLGEELIK